MADRTTFDYAGYNQAGNFGLTEEELQDQRFQDVLYRDAVDTSVKDFKKTSLMKERQAILETEKILPDTRNILGIPKERTLQEQRELLGANAYKQYVADNELHLNAPDEDIELYIDSYVKTLTDKSTGQDWANPNIAARTSKELRTQLEGSLDSVKQGTLAEWISAPPEEAKPVKDDVTRTEEANQGLLGKAVDILTTSPIAALNQSIGELSESEFANRVTDAFGRSLSSDDAQDALNDVLNVPTSYFEGSLRQGGRTVQRTPEEVEASRDEAIKRMVAARNKRDETELDAGLKTILQSENFSGAIKNIANDPAAMAVVIAEQGFDVIEETAVQVAGTVVGSLTPAGPVGGVVAGAAAASVAVKNNVYNSFLLGEIEDSIAEQKLPFNAENVKAFMDDEEKLNEAKRKASISSNIITGGSFASALIGGGVTLSAVAKTATRLGLKPVEKAGEVVWEQTAKRTVGALAAAGVASTAIDVAAEASSKLAIGEEVAPGELALEAVAGSLGAGVDVGSGVIARIGTTADAQTEIKIGDTLIDSEGNEVTVTGGDFNKVQVVGDKTETVEGFGERTSPEVKELSNRELSGYSVKPKIKLNQESTELESTIDVEGNLSRVKTQEPTADTKYDTSVDNPTGLDLEADFEDTSNSNIGALFVNDHIERVAVATGLDAPVGGVGERNNGVSALQESFSEKITGRIGRAKNRLVNGQPDNKSANLELLNALKEQGLVQELEGGSYGPVVQDSANVQSSDDLQIGAWYAAIANSAASDLPIPYQQVGPDIPQSLVEQRMDEFRKQSLVERTDLRNMIDTKKVEMQKTLDDNDGVPTAETDRLSDEIIKAEDMLEASEQKFFTVSGIAGLLPSQTQEELVANTLAAAEKARIDDLRTTESVNDILGGLLDSKEVLIGRQRKGEDVSQDLGRVNAEIDEAQRYLGVDIEQPEVQPQTEPQPLPPVLDNADEGTRSLAEQLGLNGLDTTTTYGYDNAVLFDLETNEFLHNDNIYNYISVNSDENGIPVSVVAELDGEQVTLDDPNVVYEVESQIIEQETEKTNSDIAAYVAAIKEIEDASQSDTDDNVSNEVGEGRSTEAGDTETNARTSINIDEFNAKRREYIAQNQPDETPAAPEVTTLSTDLLDNGKPFKTKKAVVAAIKEGKLEGEPVKIKKGQWKGVLANIDGTEKLEVIIDENSPVPAGNRNPSAVNLVVPVSKEAVTVNFGDVEGNFIPAAKVEAIQDAGYTVELHTNKSGHIVALTLTDNDLPKRKLLVTTSGVSNNSESNKDRQVTVRLGGKIADGRVSGGKIIKGAGGNKHFTIPPEAPIIKAGKDFIDSLEEAAAAAGMVVKKEEGQGVATRSVYGQRPGPTGRVAVISHDDNDVFVDGVRQTGPISLHKQSLSSAEVNLKELSDKKKARRADQSFANIAPPKPPVLHEKKAQQLENVVDDMETVYEIGGLTNDGLGIVRTGGIPLTIDTRRDTATDVINQAKIDTTHVEGLVFGGDVEGTVNFKQSDIEKFKNSLPAHIRDIIQIHYDGENPASEMGALGFFAPDYNGDGPAIHIDARSQINGRVRTLESIVSTLSEEVAHFSFNSWTTGFSLKNMEPFYDKAYDLYRSEIVSSLGAYFERYGIDPNDVPPVYKFIFVNELFSKQGTSIVDFTDNKASAPAGLSREEIDTLRTAGREMIDEFVFNMADIEGISPDNKKGIENFAKQILIAQSAGVTGKRTVFEYELGGNRMRIVPTIVGQARMTTPDTDMAMRFANRQAKLDPTNGTETGRKIRKAIYQNHPAENQISGREIQRLITSNTAIATSRANKHFRSDLVIARRANAIMKAAGIVEPNSDTYRDGYVAAFERAGIVSKKKLDVARQADDYLSTAFNVGVEDVESIRKEVNKHIGVIDGLVEEGRMSPAAAQRAIQEMTANARRYKVNWNHIRYRAYEDPNDRQDLIEMLREINPRSKTKNKVPLVQQRDNAEAAIKKIENSNRSNDAKAEAIAEQQRIIDKYDRFKHLESYYTIKNKLAPDSTTRFVEPMTQFLTNLLDDTRGYQGNGFGRLSRISANMTTGLDQDADVNTSDYHLIKFLKVIDDPLEVAVYNTHQRHEILRQMKANRRLAETLLLHGQATPSGSGESTTASGEVSLMEGQQGSVLDYIKIDKIIADDLKDQIDVQSNIQTNLVNNWLGLIKQGQTVWDAGVNIANYVGAPLLSMFNGHLLYFNKIAKSGSGMREAWVQRHSGSGTKGGYIQQMVNEMNDNDVLGTGAQVASLEIINQNNVLQNNWERMTKLVQDTGVVSEEGKIGSDAGFTAFIELVQDMYTFSDDAPKILAYMINRDKATTKWKAKIRREDYTNPKAYEDAIEQNAIREAADRTLRENTDWGVAPLAIKKLSFNNNTRFLFMDYLMHNTQMVKIVTENVRLFKEDAAELKEAKLNGDQEWINSVRASIASRAIGNVTIGAPLGYLGFTGYSMMADSSNAVLTWVNEQVQEIDSEEDDRDDLMDKQQVQAASRLLNFFDFDGGAKYEPLAVKKGDDIFAVNFGRMSPFNTFAAPPEESTDPSGTKQFVGWMKRMVLAGESGTNAQQLYDAARGIDWKGDPIEDSWLYFKNLGTVAVNSSMPGAGKALTEGVTERGFVSGNYKPRELTAISELTGFSTKKYNIPTLLNKIGSEIGRKLAATDTTSELRGSVSKGNGSATRASIVSMVQHDLKNTEKLMKRYRYAINAGNDFGYSDRELRKMMGKKQDIRPNSGAGEDTLKDLFRGKNVFFEKSLGKMKTLMKRTKAKAVNQSDFPKEWKERAIDDIQIAIDEYKRLL